MLWGTFARLHPLNTAAHSADGEHPGISRLVAHPVPGHPVPGSRPGRLDVPGQAHRVWSGLQTFYAPCVDAVGWLRVGGGSWYLVRVTYAVPLDVTPAVTSGRRRR